MEDFEFKISEKTVHQMTKDGLIQKNLATGETENISSKEADILFGQHMADYEISRARPRDSSKINGKRLKYKPHELVNKDTYTHLRRSRLLFTAKELETFERVGRSSVNLLGQHLGAGYKGVKWEARKDLDDSAATHTANNMQDALEFTVSRSYNFHKNFFKKTYGDYRNHRTKKLEKNVSIKSLKAEKAKLNLDKYELRQSKTNPAKGSKDWQKKRLQRKYAKAVRDSEKASKKLEKAVRNANKFYRVAIRKVLELLGITTKAIYVVIGVVVLSMIAIFAAFGLLAFLAWLIITTSSYKAEPKDIHDASVMVTQLEAELEKQIQDIPLQPQWSNIDEFRYFLDPIGHNPLVLMAWLTVKYEDFKFDDPNIQRFLRELHNARYDLRTEVEIEIRENTYEDEEGNEYTEEYEYYILNVTLISKTIEEIIEPEMDLDPTGDMRDIYDTLMNDTKGGRQIVANPFDFDWTSSFSSVYGYRVDPLGSGELQFHRGLDIPMPAGTPIKAGVSGRVIETGYDSTYGNFIIIEDKKGEVQVKYAHCDAIKLPAGAEIKAGKTIIATTGNSGGSTGAHLHIEVKDKGEYLNPIYAVDWEANAL